LHEDVRRKYWLGHADLNTTHMYVEIDMGTKRKMLDRTAAPKMGKNPIGKAGSMTITPVGFDR
jgi:hypothetical protein